MHWVRDVTFAEDAHQLRTGHAPAVLAGLRDIMRGAPPQDRLGQHRSRSPSPPRPDQRPRPPCYLELSTLAAAWHYAYGGQRPDLARAPEFYDRWLPGTIRHVAAITSTCVPVCAMRRRSW